MKTSAGCFVRGKCFRATDVISISDPLQAHSTGSICIQRRQYREPLDAACVRCEGIGFLTAAQPCANQYFPQRASEQQCCISNVFGACVVQGSTCLWDHMMFQGCWSCSDACTSLSCSELPGLGPDIALYTAKANTIVLREVVVATMLLVI